MYQKHILIKKQIEFYLILFLVFISVAVGVTFFAIAKDEPAPSGITTSGQTTQPPADVNVQISLHKPQNGSTLSATALLEAKSTYPLDGLLFILDNPDSVISPDKQFSAQNISGDRLTWQYTLNSAELSNGSYAVSVIGFVGLKAYPAAQTLTIFINNLPSSIDFLFIQPSQSQISGIVTLLAQSNVLVDSAQFEISGPAILYYPAIIDGRYIQTQWDTASFPNGEYKVGIVAKKLDRAYASNISTFFVNNTAPTIQTNTSGTAQLPPTQEAPQTPPPIDIFLFLPDETPVSKTVRLEAKASSALDELIFIITGSSQEYQLGGRLDGASWISYWDTLKVPNGSYAVIAKAKAQGFVYQTKPFTLNVQNIGTEQAVPVVFITSPLPYSKISRSAKFLVAVSNAKPDRMFIKIFKELHKFSLELNNDPANQSIWYVLWDSTSVNNGGYTAQAMTSVSGAQYASERIVFQVENVEGGNTQQEGSFIPKENQDNAPEGISAEPELEHNEIEKTTAGEIRDGDNKTMRVRENFQKNQRDSIKEKMKECSVAGIVSEEGCKIYQLKKIGITDECIRVKIFNIHRCQEFLRLPNDCINEGILDLYACQRFKFSQESQKNNDSSRVASVAQDSACVGKDDAECQKIIAREYFPQECKAQEITSKKECEEFLQKITFPSECVEKHAFTQWECNNIIKEKYFEEECQRQKITSSQECFDYIFDRYISKIGCQGLDDISCKEVLRRRHLGVAAKKIKESEKIKEILDPFINSDVTLRPKDVSADGDDLTQITSVEDIVPIVVKKETNVLFIPAAGTVELLHNDRVESLANAVMLSDFDQDGLSDDVEERLGTNPRNPDSDGDGYLDGIEVRGGFNPLGTGPIQKKLGGIDEALVARANIEHPKISGILSEDLEIEKVEDVAEPASIDENRDGTTNTFYKFSGKGIPGEVVAIYVYSDLPLLLTTTVDEFGNWSYTLKESLRDGEHEAYVTINDSTGKVVEKSNPYSFFIKEAKAVTAKEFFIEGLSARSSSWDNVKSYLLIAGAVMLLGIVLVIYFLLHGKKDDYF